MMRWIRRLARLMAGLAGLVVLAPALASAAVSSTPTQAVDAILRRAMADRHIPGLQAAVVIDGKVVFSRSYGLANLQTPTPVTAETLFSVNSISKAFTGVAVMQEVEAGRLDLSAPISTYLDDLPPGWGRVTVSQLMGQVSGLPDIYAFAESDLTGISDEAKAWAWVITQPVSPPGEKADYCQTNLLLAQRIVNKLEGRAPDSPIIGEELKRAGMTHTAYGDSRDVIAGKSAPYRFLNSEGVLRNQFERFGPMMHPSSGLNTNADDMARWMISILADQQMSSVNRKVMWTPVETKNGKLSDFGIGWDAEPGGLDGKVGMIGGSRSAFALYPGHRVGVVILTNLLGANPEELTDEVAAAFVQDLKLSPVASLRARAEQSGFENLDALLAQALAQGRSSGFDEGELESWIRRLLYSGSIPRAVTLAKFDVEVFPKSEKALEYLAKAYVANEQNGAARDAYAILRSRDPQNVAARAFFASP